MHTSNIKYFYLITDYINKVTTKEKTVFDLQKKIILLQGFFLEFWIF